MLQRTTPAMSPSLAGGEHAVLAALRGFFAMLGRNFRRQGNTRLRREFERLVLNDHLRRDIGLDGGALGGNRPSDYEQSLRHLIRQLER